MPKMFLALLLFTTALLQSCAKEDPMEWDKPYNLSVMSFNLRYDEPADGENQWQNRKEKCIALLKQHKPSVFGIQEGLHHQVSFLEDNLPDYEYVGVGSEDGHSGGEYKAIFYSSAQFEALEDDTFWLSETPDVPSRGWDANNIRIVTWVKLRDKTHDQVLYVFNTHFDHIGDKSRVESARLLMKKIHEMTSETDQVFITGDFNALIRNKMFKPIINEFYSAKRFADYSDNTNSFNAFGRWYISRNIDFIFYNNAHALAYRTISDNFGVPFISDHYPIISYFNY